MNKLGLDLILRDLFQRLLVGFAKISDRILSCQTTTGK